MLSVSRLLNGTVSEGDALRYGRARRGAPAHMLHFAEDKRPVVVWNMTRQCNLFCMHCYATASKNPMPGELTTDEGYRLIDQLADFEVPSILFSGGEPLMRQDLFELADYARQVGLRTVLSTNGTLIDGETAARIKETGFSYVGISLDGLEGTHDKVRGKKGAFQSSIEAIRHLRASGVRTGLRYTVHAKNLADLPAVLDLLESEGIDRCCFYHLAYSGRGERISSFDLAPEETRAALDFVFDRAEELHRRGIEREFLTVDNHADSAYLYLRVKERQPERAEEVLKLLRRNGGNQSGVAIASVHPTGTVHADQFSWSYSFGNVRERSFGEIWTDVSDPRMRVLKDRQGSLPERCQGCRWLDICNGNLRARAEYATGDFLGPDPACYLTDAEIAAEA
ncbi:MAG TPA: radical SAM protein [Tepidiformaceae bacterium]